MSSFLNFLKKSSTTIIAIAVIGGSFGIGMYVGSQKIATTGDTQPSILNGNVGKPEDVNFSLFWKAWDVLEEKHVPTHNEGTTTNEQKVYGAIKGLAAAYGDPYTTFFPPVENEAFQTEIAGNFEGVGMEVGIKDNIITVIAPLKGTPAANAGIKSGDRIVSINGTTTADMTVEEAVKLIRGKKGTVVTFSLFRDGDTAPHEVKVTRDVINIPTLETEKRSDGIFVIRLFSFTQNSSQLFQTALQEFVESNSSKLILDLRGNPGGYLDSAVEMASWFLPKDALVVKEDSGGRGDDKEYKSYGQNIFNENLKMVILVDGGSASASEILAGALSEHGVAELVGSQTFGKGSVQELVPLTKDTSLKITIARWLTPKGVSISDQGLKPDFVVPFTQEDANKKIDPQLNKAVEILNK
jgi:carboxyl-terminal processing protease